MKTKFRIFKADTSVDLEKGVEWALNDGWQIVNVGMTVRQTWFAAMVKEADAEEYTR